MNAVKQKLDHLYEQYNQYEFIDPDPLVFVYQYTDNVDREVAGFIAACFAYGRVEMIMKTVKAILASLHPSPAWCLNRCTRAELEEKFKDFRYRFADGHELINLLWGLKKVLKEYSSLENCFKAGMNRNNETIVSGLQHLSNLIRDNNPIGHLLADPHKTSACKRSHLFLRWMVRKDRVDPGCWKNVPASKLVVPLDRHMHTAGTLLGFTQRKSADFKTALEITSGFKKINPSDPVKYDFCLTRFGIRRELSMEALEELVC